MSETKLNRKRSYGIVTGHPDIKFIQDGIQFRNDGSAFSIPEAPVPQPIVAPEPDEETLAIERNKKRAETMRKIWAARKEAGK